MRLDLCRRVSVSPQCYSTPQMDHLPMCPCGPATRPETRPAAVSPRVLVATIRSQKRRGIWPGWMLLILEGGSVFNGSHGELGSRGGARCTLSTHMYTHWELYRKGCCSRNKHKSIASPSPYTNICPGLSPSISPYMCTRSVTRTMLTTLQVLLKVLWERC